MACVHQLYLRHMYCNLLTVTRMSTNQTLISNIFQESAIKLKRSAFIENSREFILALQPWHTISVAESMKNNKRITKAMNRTTEMQHKSRLMRLRFSVLFVDFIESIWNKTLLTVCFKLISNFHQMYCQQIADHEILHFENSYMHVH